jgi:predicted nucleic acid-binding protein
MHAYADTNFLTALISTGTHGDEAQRLRQIALNRNAPPFPVTFLTRMEVINAIHQQVFFTRNGVPGIHASPEAAAMDASLFADELRLGETMIPAEIDVEMLVEMFGSLVGRHTIKHGFRTYDIIHVASAILLGCDTFWSFDAKAKKLAELEGLTVN